MIRKAHVTDVPLIQALINRFADEGKMLHRSLNQLYLNLRSYFVVEEEGEIVGCAALHLFGAEWAEIKSIAVREDRQRYGYGRILVEACLQEAQELGVPRVFALTFQPEFFEKSRFRRVERDALPAFIWAECLFCPGYPDCGEVPMVIELD
jgi:amino-acid N-acetyltransferase